MKKALIVWIIQYKRYNCSKTDMPVDELPENVHSYLKTHYKGVKVKEAAKIVKANGEVNSKSKF